LEHVTEEAIHLVKARKERQGERERMRERERLREKERLREREREKQVIPFKDVPVTYFLDLGTTSD
jgi:hypothetical protein